MTFIAKLFNFVFPKTCAACGAFNDEPVCRKCFSEIKFIGPSVCEKCGLPLSGRLPGQNLCGTCIKRGRGAFFFEKIRGICLYEGPVKKLINRFKYERKDYLSKTLAGIIEKGLNGFNFVNQCDLIAPVPLHWKKRFLRGFNQSELLAKHLSAITGIALETGGLKREKSSRPQVGLSRNARMENVKDAFIVKTPLFFYSKTILLVDDVSTTCETLNQCAKALKTAGASAVYCLTLARDI